jgi:hypothetical protein
MTTGTEGDVMEEIARITSSNMPRGSGWKGAVMTVWSVVRGKILLVGTRYPGGLAAHAINNSFSMNRIAASLRARWRKRSSVDRPGCRPSAVSRPLVGLLGCDLASFRGRGAGPPPISVGDDPHGTVHHPGLSGSPAL